MDYISTRGEARSLDFCDVLLEGLATDGGLYMPSSWPFITKEEINNFANLSYAEIAFKIMKPFVEGSLDDTELLTAITKAVASFRNQDITPLVPIGDNRWLLELFYGPTLAFKDHALQFLGQVFDIVLKKKNKKITIVGATSGDTGSAAIEACKNSAAIDIFILHPKGRVSDVQRKQMTTVDSSNVFNIAIEGDFDDCQNLVKMLFADERFRRDFNLSAVNSINWARIMAQTVYYFVALSRLGGEAKKPYFVVPTGNFGNIFAGFASYKMGLPITKLVSASNSNDILTRFFESSIMLKHQVMPSLSPSMDIQVSSNFERFLFEIYGRNSKKVVTDMKNFAEKGKYQVANEAFTTAKTIFAYGRCNDEQTKAEIKRVYLETGLLIDPHTAVGSFAARGRASSDNEPLVVLATAHPAKFPDAVKEATGIYPKLPDFMQDLFAKKEHYTTLDKNLDNLKKFIKSRSHTTKGS